MGNGHDLDVVPGWWNKIGGFRTRYYKKVTDVITKYESHLLQNAVILYIEKQFHYIQNLFYNFTYGFFPKNITYITYIKS